VEQLAAGRLEGVGSLAKVDGDSTVDGEGDHVAGLTEECRPLLQATHSLWQNTLTNMF
jgi:hypothetical protein